MFTKLACALAFTSAVAPVAAVASTAADLCSLVADPCVVATSLAIAPGAILDLGGRALRLTPTARLSFGSGNITINAGSFTMMPGAQLLGTDPTLGGDVVVRTTGPIDVQGVGAVQATIAVSSAGYAGLIDLASSAGSVNVDGELFAIGTGTGGTGGTINLQAAGNVAIGGGQLSVASAPQGTGGDITVLSDAGGIEVGQPIDSSGGDGGGGTIDIEAGGDVVTRGQLNVAGGGSSGDGGSVTLLAGGSVQMLGPEYGSAAGDQVDGGGTGADLSVTATAGNVVMDGIVTNTGAPPDGSGGTVSIVAGTDISQTAAYYLAGPGIDGCGGDMDMTASGDIVIDKTDVSGGSCGAGTVDVEALGTISGPAGIVGDSPDSGFGGTLGLTAGTVNLTGMLRTTGPVAEIQVQACTLNLAGTGTIKVSGDASLNLLQAAGQMSLAGAVQAGTGVNRFEYRDPSHVPTYKASLVSPAPVLAVNLNLPPCAGATTTTLPTSTTTTTHAVSSSTLVTTTTTATATTVVATSSTLAPTTTTVPGQLTFATRNGRTGCLLEWKVQNPNGARSHGLPATTQTCVDGDPSCDLDGVSDGVCTYAVGACLAARDPQLPLCQPSAIDLVDLERPTPVAPADPVEAANATMLMTALDGLGVEVASRRTVLQPGAPVSQRDLCAAPVAIRVPHAPGLIGKQTLLAAATAGRSRQRRNRVTLVCAPNTAVCGNGVVELGEQCDDGNTNACDGCSPTCRVERCGDGVVQCNEQCDDGDRNGAPGDPCSAQCTVAPPPLRIPGGGTAASDCRVEYSVGLDTTAIGRAGLPSSRQACTDGDPTCDFDPTPGTCRLHLWVCAGGDDARLACAAERVAGVTVTKPSRGPLASALRAGVAALPFPLGPGETCSREIDVDVPAGRAPVVVQTTALDALGASDRDVLRLSCTSASARRRDR